MAFEPSLCKKLSSVAVLPLAFSAPEDRMSVLWLAFGLYIIGVGLVLFFRPSLMFQEGAGVWKEFGIGTAGQRTVFPFWLFTIVWAIVSYVIATLGSVYLATLSLHSIPPPPSDNDFLVPISTVGSRPAPPEPMPSVVAPPPLSSKTPGYYILEPASAVEPPRYVYFGTEPPMLSNLRRH